MESSVFSICSASSSRELVFSDRKEGYFQVSIKGNISAKKNVYDYMDSQGLLKLFQEIATYPKPWQGEKCWKSLEGDFSISASCSHLGHVLFCVELCDLQGLPEQWMLDVGLETELGQLEKIARDANVFFNKRKPNEGG